MKRIDKKHVMLSMSNGYILEGFVVKMEEEYLILVENNNGEVIVKIKDISFARPAVSVAPQVNEYRPAEVENYSPVGRLSNDEFAMPMPRPNDDPYVKQPELIRSTK